MANWIKWWESKFAWTIIGLALAAIALSFLPAYFLMAPINGILASLVAIIFGFIIRKVIIKKIGNLS